MMSELTIRAFLNDGGKLKKEKADDQTMKDIEKYFSKLVKSETSTQEDKELRDSIVTSIKKSINKEKKNER
tara:strand:- start:597 stop:809 length:213 start_codon:yes stop_codon:yes gene_type:complete